MKKILLLFLIHTCCWAQTELDKVIQEQKWSELKFIAQKNLVRGNNTKETWLALALATYKEGKIDEAVQDLIKLKNRYPFFYPAYFNLGLIQTELKNYQEAKNSLSLARKIRPNNIEILLALTEVHRHLNDFEGAQKIWRDIFKRQRVSLGLQLLYSQFLRKMRKLPQAEGVLIEALSLAPESLTLHLAYAELLQDIGEWAVLEKQLRGILILAPKNIQAKLMLAKLLAQTQRLDDASKHFEECLQLNNSIEIYQDYIAAYLMNKEFAGALKLTEIALNIKTTPTLWSQQGQALIGLERFDEAQESFVQAKKQSAKLETPYLYLGALYERLNLPHEAMKIYEEGLNHLAASWPIHLALGQVLYHQGLFADALLHFQEVTRLNQQLARPHYLIVDCALKLERLSIAQKHLEILETLVDKDERTLAAVNK